MIILPSKRVKDGLKPLRHDHRDYDYIKTKKLGGILPASIPDFNVDAGLWMPNQETENAAFTPPIPALPFGCTDYAQNELCMDEDGVLQNPMDIENVTHANASGGTDLRTSLKAVVKLRGDKHPNFFAIKSSGIFDWFDAVRVSLYSTSSQKRGASIGSPWYPDFNTGASILPIPDFSLSRASWHDWCIKGQKTISGEVYLIGKPWLGKDYGDAGFVYFSRPLFNALMNINGTGAYTLDKLLPGEQAQSVDSNIVQKIVSYIRNLLGL